MAVVDADVDPATGSAAVSPAKTAADPTSPVDATPVRPGKRAAEPFVMTEDGEHHVTPSKTQKTAEENEAAEKEKQAAKRK